MSRVFHPDAVNAASALQRKASDPNLSVWVSADAGTGKTEVLTQRVLRLLLDDPTLLPDQILALTFTKAGASEMALRLPNPRRARDRAPWLALNDSDLRDELETLLQRPVQDADLVRARALPSLMAERPAWVTTIHGFCQQVLSRFPHEAGVPEGFDVLDDVAQRDLLRHASQRALEHADGAVAEALTWLLGHMADSSLSTLTDLLVRDWVRLRDVLGERNTLACRLREQLDVTDVAPQGFALSAADIGTLRVWADALRTGGKTDKELAADVDALTARTMLAWPVVGGELQEIFLTQKLQKTTEKRLSTNPVKAALGSVWDDVLNLQTRVHEQVCAERRYVAYRMTLDVLTWAGSVADYYSTLKRERGALDFADLIASAEALLLKNTAGWRDWVMYRLDKQLRHLMVDESQDNSPAQGRLVELLARELLSGDTGEGARRTVFAVGDVKQSIYRFQGAAPELFVRLGDVMREYPGAEITGLSHSFRTTRAVLDTVNDVFSGQAGEILRGVDVTTINHKSVMPDGYGRVELWPLLPAEPKSTVAPWTPPELRQQSEAGPLRVGRQVAADIKRMAEQGVVLDCTGKTFSYGDAMILTQRNETAAQILAALRGAGIPAVMTGADDELPMVASDLLALMRALWNPADTLALAQVLKSALVGWRDAQVLQWRLACKKKSVWDALRDVDGHLADWMVRWRERLLQWPPYRWLVTLVREHDLTARYHDLRGVDVLLDAALREAHVLRVLVRHEQGGITLPKMTGSAGNRVRVMTVHQSKGLEAPLVFMVDTTRKATARNSQREKLLFDLPAPGVPGGVLYWGSSGAGGVYQERLEAEERARKLADSYRLLYVAMTRAKERLVVCGWDGSGATDVDDDGNPETWYAALTKAREANPTAWRQEGEVWVREGGSMPTALPSAPILTATDALPVWAQTPCVAVEDAAVAPALSAEQHAALEYGTLMHRLLAIVPHGDELAVRRAAEAWVARNAPPEIADTMIDQAMAVWHAQPEAFGEGSAAEVPLGLRDGTVGRMDRLVVRADEVWIVDFKTERVVPPDVPASYKAQLESYAATVRQAWPDRRVRCALVWVNGVRVDWLD